MDIHNFKRRLERTLEKISKSSISKQDKTDLVSFHNFCFSTGIGPAKIQRYLFDLEKIAHLKGKTFRDCDKKDVQNIIVKLEKTDYADETKRGFKIGVKKFFKWLRDIDDKGVYPDEVKWISTTSKSSKHRLPEELLTEEEIVKMIDFSKNKRDKAFIAVLYESGCRIAEVLTIKLKNVAFDDLGTKISVFGKTGSRRIRLVSSESYIKEWINNHPNKDDPDSYVWVRSDNKIIGYPTVRKQLTIIAKRAGIKKKVNPHSFRHARATHLANFLTEAQLKEVFGWTQGSDMASIYVHLSSRDTDEAILKLYGKQPKNKTTQKSLLTPKTCNRCHTENEATNKFCKLCGLILDTQESNTIVKNELERKSVDDLMNKIVEDKDILKLKEISKCVHIYYWLFNLIAFLQFS
jgi:site-specific recombinase XerD